MDALPASVVAAVAKAALPEGTGLSREAKAGLQRAAGIFVLYLGAAAEEARRGAKPARTTLQGVDVLAALENCDLPELKPVARAALDAAKAARATRQPAVKRARSSAADDDKAGSDGAPSDVDGLAEERADAEADATTEAGADGEAASAAEEEEESTAAVAHDDATLAGDGVAHGVP